MSVKLKEYELLKFALEVDYKQKKGNKIMTYDEIRNERKYKNDMQFEIILPNGNVERKYITQRRLREIYNIRLKVVRVR